MDVDQIVGTFRQNNPGMLPFPPAQPAEGMSLTPLSASSCSTARVHLAGGTLMQYIGHPSIIPFESVYRRFPQDGIFTASPTEPFRFEMGAFRVPEQMVLVMLDQRFDIYRPSGFAAGDFIPFEDRRLPISVGWNMRATTQLQGNFHYELQPYAPTDAFQQFGSNPNPGFIPGGNGQLAPPGAFAQAQAMQVLGASGAGDQVMQQRHHRDGLMKVPFPFYIREKEALQFECVVFNAIPVPVAFFEVEVVGVLLPLNQVSELNNSMVPCRSQQR